MQITYTDNGIGLLEDFNISTADSLGLTLIRVLSSKIDAGFTIENKEGVNCVLKMFSNREWPI